MGGWQVAPDQPGEPPGGGGSGDTNREVYSYVYICERWGQEWILQQRLQALSLNYRAAPSIPTATLLWHYGVIKYEDETTFVSRTQLPELVSEVWDSQSWVDKYVLIETYKVRDDGSLDKLLPNWVGKIAAADVRPHGQGNEREVSGEVVLQAVGLEVELDRVHIDSTIRRYATTLLMRSADVQSFNLFGEQRAAILGNRTTTTVNTDDPIPLDTQEDGETEYLDLEPGVRTPIGGVFVFGEASAGSQAFWSARDVADYLCAMPRQTKVPFSVADTFGALTNLREGWRFAGMSNYRALCSLINPARGLGFFIDADGQRDQPDLLPNIRVFTATDVPIGSGGQVLPANGATVNFGAEFGEDIRVESLAASIDSERSFDIVRAFGERLRIVGSFSNQDDTLDAGWSAFDELAYKKGSLGPIESDPVKVRAFLAQDYPKQLAAHDAFRHSDRFLSLFTTLRFSGSYSGGANQYPRLGSGGGCIAPGGAAIKCTTPAIGMADTRSPWMPRTIEGGLVTTAQGNAPAWAWGKRFEATTPLIEGYDYSEAGMDAVGDAAPYDIPDGEPRYRPPFVLVPITDTNEPDPLKRTKWYFAERLAQVRGYHPADLRAEPTGLAVGVVFPYRHYAAGPTYRAGVGELSEIQTNHAPLVDEGKLRVLHISGYNGTSAALFGTLNATAANKLTWTPPGGGTGPEITIDSGQTKAVYGEDPTKYVVVTRTGSGDLSGSLDIYCPGFFNAEPSAYPAVIDWRKFILTASFEADQRPFVTASTGLSQNPDTTRVAHIDVKGAELHWMHPSCIVDVDHNGQLVKCPMTPPAGQPATTLNGWRTIRNDRVLLQQTAACAAAWYGKRRRHVRISWQTVGWFAGLGDIVKKVHGLLDMEGGESNTPVTAISVDLVQMTTTLETSYMELSDSLASSPNPTARGDSLQLPSPAMADTASM